MHNRKPIEMAAFITGAVFVLVGVMGFIPGITTNYGDMTFSSHESDAQLLGIFQVSILHNIVHLLFGIAGIALSRSMRSAYQYLLYGGMTYFALFVYGAVIDKHSSANFVPVNGADDVLHLLLSIGMVGTALALRERRSTMPSHP